MARIATELGATIRLNEPVEQVLFEGRRAAGVRTSSGEIRADAVGPPGSGRSTKMVSL
ncbi:MAG TPA: hypothetical protein PLF91_08605 [Mycolicibacterium fallax]|nr:hypothetical protein [Mycolicibacterium fallax]